MLSARAPKGCIGIARGLWGVPFRDSIRIILQNSNLVFLNFAGPPKMEVGMRRICDVQACIPGIVKLSQSIYILQSRTLQSPHIHRHDSSSKIMLV